jgi:hypothetical protein
MDSVIDGFLAISGLVAGVLMLGASLKAFEPMTVPVVQNFTGKPQKKAA